MSSYLNRRAAAVTVVLAIIMAGSSLRWSSPAQTLGYVAAFLVVATALNVLLTRARRG